MYPIIAISAIAVCTFLIRLCPFVIFSKGNETPKNVLFIGNVLPAAMIACLIVYCFKTVNFADYNSFVPPLISCVITALLHHKFGNTLLSIGGGTACYMILIRTLFAV